jgi:hypothetical protein
VRWSRFAMVARSLEGIRRSGMGLGARPDERGRFVVCGVPIDHPIEVELRSNKALLQRDTLRLQPPGLKRFDYRITK